MRRDTDCQAYLLWLAGTVIVGLIVTTGLVVFVDPYDLYGVFKRSGFNAVKPGLSRYIDEIKLAQAVRLKPDMFIMGNSRAEIGFDPESPAIVQLGLSAYNLAVPGSSIQSSRRQLEYLGNKGIGAKTILVGLEFLDFLTAPHHSAVASNNSPTVALPIQSTERRFWRLDCLFSMASLKDALGTLLIQTDEDAITMTSRGFNPLKEYRAMARNEGYYALFRQRAQENSITYVSKAASAIDDVEFGQVRAILDQAAKSGAETVLIIYPYHAQILALLEAAGLWTSFQQWKDRVVTETTAVRARHPAARIDLFDFSGYGPFQCERIPGKGDVRSTTRWYWEAGHFKKELGEIVMETALSQSVDTKVKTPDEPVFGMRLDVRTADMNRQRLARERSECARVYPQLFSEAKELVDNARSNRHDR